MRVPSMSSTVQQNLWPSWLKIAYSFKGVKEIPGKQHSPTIQKWLSYLSAWWNDDETPWCGVFVGYVMKRAGYAIPKMYMRAKSWLDWGSEIPRPVVGCVAILERKGGGHVFFVIAMTEKGNLVGIGGNQGNAVTIAEFSTDRVLGYRVPKEWDIARANSTPIVASSAALSVNEA